MLCSSSSIALTVEAKLLKKLKVEFIDDSGYFEFLKFQNIKTESVFLVSQQNDKYDKKFFKRKKVYSITYGEGGLWKDFENNVTLKDNEDLDKYPVHFLIEAERKD